MGETISPTPHVPKYLSTREILANLPDGFAAG